MKTLSQQETEAFLAMAEAIKALEQQLADAKARIEQLEAQRYTYQWPSYPPYKITCNGVEIGNN
jgi:hypothetical protein